MVIYLVFAVNAGDEIIYNDNYELNSCHLTLDSAWNMAKLLAEDYKKRWEYQPIPSIEVAINNADIDFSTLNNKSMAIVIQEWHAT